MSHRVLELKIGSRSVAIHECGEVFWFADSDAVVAEPLLGTGSPSDGADTASGQGILRLVGVGLGTSTDTCAAVGGHITNGHNWQDGEAHYWQDGSRVTFFD